MLVSVDGTALRSSAPKQQAEVDPVPETLVPLLQDLVRAVRLVEATQEELKRNEQPLNQLNEMVQLRADPRKAEEFKDRLAQVRDPEFIEQLGIGTFFDNISEPQIKLLVEIFRKLSTEEAAAITKLFGAITAYQQGIQYLLNALIMAGSSMAESRILMASPDQKL